MAYSQSQEGDGVEAQLAAINGLASDEIVRLLLQRTEVERSQRRRKVFRQVIRRCLARGISDLWTRLSLDGLIADIKRPSFRRKVLFLCILPTFNMVRESIFLRRRGFETILLTENPWMASFNEPYFDHVHVYDSRYDVARVLRDTVPYVVHVQGAMCISDYYGVLAKLLSRSPVVVEFFDVAGLSLSLVDAIELFGPVDAKLGFFAEEFVCKHADGIIVGYSSTALEILKTRYSVKVPMLEFHAYACEEFSHDSHARYSERDGQIHLVYGGNVARSTLPARLFGDVQFHGLIEKVTRQGIHLAFYSSPLLSRLRTRQFLSDYFTLARENPRFRFHAGIPLDQATREFGKYDFGAMIYLFDRGTFQSEHNQGRLPGKFFTYLEAGLPLVVSEELAYVAEHVRKYDIGVVVSQRDLGSLAEILSRCDMDRLRHNVQMARRELSMEQHIGRLVSFYETVAGSKRRRVGDT